MGEGKEMKTEAVLLREVVEMLERQIDAEGETNPAPALVVLVAAKSLVRLAFGAQRDVERLELAQENLARRYPQVEELLWVALARVAAEVALDQKYRAHSPVLERVVRLLTRTPDVVSLQHVDATLPAANDPVA